MTVNVTIRNVPTSVRDELAARAALEGRSMQEYLVGELERLASRPTAAQWVAEVRERKAAYGARLPGEEIVRHRDAERR